LGVAHRVAPDAPAKGKIERRFDTFQKRLASILSFEGVDSYPQANQLLQTQICWHNQQRACRSTGLIPQKAWELALKENRSQLKPTPAKALLDLHFALHLNRKLNFDSTIDFLGRSWPVSPSKRKTITIVHHPGKCFWAISQPPSPSAPQWPLILASYTL
jgi:hypothetical protein